MRKTLPATFLTLIPVFIGIGIACVFNLNSSAEESYGDDASKHWIELLSDDSFDVRNSAETKLISEGKDAIAALKNAILSSDAEVRFRASRALIRIEWLEGCKDELAWLTSFGPALGALTRGSSLEKKTIYEGVKFERPLPNPDDPELALNPALEWLSRNQEPDGHWNSVKFGSQIDADVEQTALAILAFLSVGHSDKVGKYKDNLRKAADWLGKQQYEDGSIRKPDQPVDGIAHAIAGLALAELAGMNPKSNAKEYAQKSIDYSAHIYQSTKGTGKWGFGKTPNSDSPNLFITTFFIMQFKSAKVSGLKVGADHIEGVLQFVNSLECNNPKAFRFAEGLRPSPKATLMGCLCKLNLGCRGEDLAPMVERVIEDAINNVVAEDSDLLMNYIGILVFYQFGGSRWNGASGLWKEFREVIHPKLGNMQRMDGNAKGSWNPIGTWSGSGRALSTALNALCTHILSN